MDLLKSLMLSTAMLIITVVVLLQAGWAQEYVVDVNHPQASDENPGTEEKPFRTIGRGMQALQPGDVVLIKAGEYRESVTVNANGTPDQPISIQAYPGHEGKVIIKGSDVFTDWKQHPGQPLWSIEWKHRFDSHYPKDWEDFGAYAKRCEMVFADGEPLRQVLAHGLLMRGTFHVDEEGQRLYIALRSYALPKKVEVAVRQRGLFVRGSYIRLKGLVVMHVANPHDEAAFEVVGSDIVLENCRAEWNNLDGFRLAGRRIRMANGIANHNGRCGISASIHDSVLENNITDENSWRFGPDWHAGGMKIVGGAPSGNRIVGHIARNNNGRGIWFDYGCRNNRVERCFLHGNLIAGLELEACLAENWIINNIICHTRIFRDSLTEHGTGAGILLYEAHRTHIYHNTIVGNERFGILIGGGSRTIGYDGSEAFSAETDITNNLIAENGVAGIGFWVWGKSAEPQILATHRSDFNLWWQPGALIALLPAKPGLPKQPEAATLADWQAAFGQDQHSLAADPKFAGKSRCDFHLQPDSPAIDKGKVLEEVTEDFAGNKRPQGKAADVGAYEMR